MVLCDKDFPRGLEEAWEACVASRGPPPPHPLVTSWRRIYLFGSSMIRLSPRRGCPLPSHPTLVTSGLVPPCWNEALACWGIQGPTRAWGQAWTSELGTLPAWVEPGLLLPSRGGFLGQAFPLSSSTFVKDTPALPRLARGTHLHESGPWPRHPSPPPSREPPPCLGQRLRGYRDGGQRGARASFCWRARHLDKEGSRVRSAKWGWLSSFASRRGSSTLPSGLCDRPILWMGPLCLGN